MVLLEKQWVNVQEKTFTKWFVTIVHLSGMALTSQVEQQDQES